ncbi:hypothetical protein M0813_04954 [Anaeramoeba flamelloides]|uniref:MARVEL domain-containing protein n=1 Tax=Anaeramoeba flamelloides TaxID=1746091 RepID=A0AAV7ZM94_9EUKA|nr:hypothetical protein M0812_13105 [Anaeramoeba flamelloides]KAJ6232431.1 hypothetical protein M0813_04954 [Anaeramoeba flamelloides]
MLAQAVQGRKLKIAFVLHIFNIIFWIVSLAGLHKYLVAYVDNDSLLTFAVVMSGLFSFIVLVLIYLQKQSPNVCKFLDFCLIALLCLLMITINLAYYPCMQDKQSLRCLKGSSTLVAGGVLQLIIMWSLLINSVYGDGDPEF